jgi:signal transduction histidine kinase
MADQKVSLEVQDQGPGLSAADHARLFQKFAILSARPTAGESSTGLGLSIVKRLVEAMGGSVSCHSEPGAGATFAFEMRATAFSR